MTEWRQFCTGLRDVQLDGEAVIVQLGRGRQHRIDVLAAADAFELSGIVARRTVVDEIEQAALAAWKRNRASSLVGFRLDDRGRLMGESWVPSGGLTRDEFLLYVRNLAAACDLFEFQLTGKDRE
jgi:hypothetical protein